MDPKEAGRPQDYQLLEQTILVRERLTAIETKLDDLSETKKYARDAWSLSQENAQDIAEIKDANRWLFRTMVGLIIAIILKFFYDIVMPILS